MPGPLDGVRVLDLTISVMGPYAAQQLGDMGADVIKVESPDGDSSRGIGTQRNPGMASFFLGFNRNKRAIVLDLKQKAALDALMRLAKTADVVLINMRPQTAARLGVGYEAFKVVNPRIIHVSAYGYRAEGPYANNAAYDDIIQAGAGFAYLQGTQTGQPHYVPSIVADKVSGLTIVSAVLAALFSRERTGVGQSLEVPMFETMAAFVTSEHLEGETFIPPQGTMGYKRIMTAERRPYATKDGHISVLPYSDRNWSEFCRAAGRSDLLEREDLRAQSERFKQIDAFYQLVAEIVASKTTAEWLELLAKTNVPYGPMNSLQDLLNDPQLEATNFWTIREHPTEATLRYPDFPVRFSETKPSLRRLQPRLGEHSREVLAELGLSDSEIDAMLETNAAVQASAAG